MTRASKIWLPSPLLPVLVAVALSLPGMTSAQKYRDSKFNGLELAQLPKYCYWQYVDDKLISNPEYSIHGCGVYVNHYCPGLVNLMRAQNVSLHRDIRREELRMGKENFEYTLNFMPQGCWLRPQAEASLARARALQAMIR